MSENRTVARPSVDEAATTALSLVFQDVETFEDWQKASRRLGAIVSDDGLCEIAVWTPSLVSNGVAERDVRLELLVPPHGFDTADFHETTRFERVLLPTRRIGDVTLVAVHGVAAGTRNRCGTFYALSIREGDGERRVLDPMAASLPFGAFAPAEIYDVEAMLAARDDAEHWQALAGSADGTPTVSPPSNILQVHVPTATEGGTLASLTRRIREKAERIRSGAEPSASDALWLGFDAMQLLPVEPTTVYEAGPAFWEDIGGEDDRLDVRLRRPDTTNWGYDVVIAGSAAVNPTLLESGRPDELVDLACALHTFPGKPIALVFDVVFGHADNQALKVLDHAFLAGANMYGQNLDYRNPAVRAQMLEMQRRKVNFGADGVRVDGAQDFKW